MNVPFLALGHELRRRRVERLLTQAELAELVGVSERAVRAWETGAAAPDPHNLRELGRELGLDEHELGRLALDYDSAKGQGR